MFNSDDIQEGIKKILKQNQEKMEGGGEFLLSDDDFEETLKSILFIDPNVMNEDFQRNLFERLAKEDMNPVFFIMRDKYTTILASIVLIETHIRKFEEMKMKLEVWKNQIKNS